MIDPHFRPRKITVERAAACLQIEWADTHVSLFPLRWLRANCPCATCREERRNAALRTNELTLMSGPLPSTEVVGAELVGHYAVRFDWKDGHNTGLFPFSALRVACPCASCNPDGSPPLLPEE